MTQTETAFLSTEREHARVIASYKRDPVGFARDVLNVRPDLWQCRFLEAVAEHPRVAVASCTGAGKDFIAAVAVLWFLASFEKALCPCTANSQDQVEKILWKQFADLIDGSNGLGLVFEWSATTIRHRALPAEWFAFAKTSAKKTKHGERFAEGSSGHHSDNMLILMDEASGIDEEHWEAYEPTMTGPNNKLVAIGNPLRLSGSFYQIWYGARVSGFWSKMRIGGKAHPNVDYISDRANLSGNHEYLLAKYKERHPIVLAKVFGQHPTQTSEDTGYAFEEVQAARAAKHEPAANDAVQIGLDVARFGRNKTVWAIRRGRRIRLRSESGLSTDRIVDISLEIGEEEADATRPGNDYRPLLVVDETGVGGGVVDGLRRAGWKMVRGVSFGGSPRNKTAFTNVAAEMWLEDLKRYFECIHCGREFMAHWEDSKIEEGAARPCPKYVPGIDLDPDDEELMIQLISRKYGFTGKKVPENRKQIDQRFVESKTDMEARGLDSPDEADAVCLSVVRPRMARLL